jgi:hypothetical protein
VRTGQIVDRGEPWDMANGMPYSVVVTGMLNCLFIIRCDPSTSKAQSKRSICSTIRRVRITGVLVRSDSDSLIWSARHCHGHLIYEGFVGEGGGWGSTRGGDSAVRAGDILEWCNAELRATDPIGNTSTLRIGASGL